MHGVIHDGRRIDYRLQAPSEASSAADAAGDGGRLVGRLEPEDRVAADDEGKEERYFAKALLSAPGALTSEVLFCHVRTCKGSNQPRIRAVL